MYLGKTVLFLCYKYNISSQESLHKHNPLGRMQIVNEISIIVNSFFVNLRTLF